MHIILMHAAEPFKGGGTSLEKIFKINDIYDMSAVNS